MGASLVGRSILRLGQFLEQAAASHSAAPVKHVKFRVFGRDIARPGMLSADVEATMVFVSEADRQVAIRDARKELDTLYEGKPFPPDSLSDEAAYHLLYRALRDSSSDGYVTPFAESVKALKSSVNARTAGDLDSQYWAWIAEEFPEAVDETELEALVKEAREKSLADLLTSRGYLPIRRALSSLHRALSGQ